MTIQRALLSVSDKTGIVDFAKALADRNVELLSTGGTASILRDAGIKVTDVSEYTGSPEIMDGRVKTLHPKIHGALLARPGIDDDVLDQQGIIPIQLVAVNLYPFENTIANPDCDLATAIEQIDIGGPTMLRSAAKNNQSVTVLVDTNDYAQILKEMDQNDNSTKSETRLRLAQKVFSHTCQYDAAIANYLAPHNEEFPNTYFAQYEKLQDMRYGENPHQKAAFYRAKHVHTVSVATSKQLQGKALSFNNIADADAALECVKSFHDQAACVIVKHANPCGVAVASSQINAYHRAFSTDSTSAFGGIIAFNQPLEAETAQAIIDQQFVEVIIAPEITDAALKILQPKANVRVLACGDFISADTNNVDYKRVNGGLLVQERDNAMVSNDALKIVSQRQPSASELADLLFAWKVAKYVKSNAIVYAKDNATVGIGAGQMSRIDSAKIAGLKAQEAKLDVVNAVMASDAFFPFRDGIDAAANVGITAIIQPGGSIRDEEIIQAANEANIAMVFTGMRHFRH